jgi:hypothetical protein
MRFRHSIRKQTLEVEVDSEELALQLQPRLGDLNRKRLLPVIERVLDELAVPGRQLKLARLEIDLGTVPLSGFEEVVAERLSRELRRAVEKTLRELEASPTEGNRSQPEEVSWRELLEHYLLHGTLPFWAPEPEAFSLEALLQELSERSPEGLLQLLRQHGHLTHVLERLVAQLDTPRLERLLGLLDPEHAALVSDYIVNLKRLHQASPVLPLSDRAFSRVLWSLALGYRVRDPGTQFNRKSSIKSLLRGLAESHGLDYRDILATLRLGLEQTRRNHPFRSSLPAAIGELVRESELEARSQEPGGLRLEEEKLEPLPRRWAASVAPPLRKALFAFLLGTRGTPASHEDAPSHGEEVHAFLRQLLANPRRRERWVKVLPEAGLTRLCHLLEPRKHRALLEAAEVLTQAWREVVLPGQPALKGRSALWRFVLEFLSQNAAAHRSVERLAGAFFEHFAARYRSTQRGAPEEAAVGERLLKRASELARTARQTRLLSILRRDRMLLARRWGPHLPPRREPASTPSAPHARRREAARPRSTQENQNMTFKLGKKRGEEDVKDAIYIQNAGLVLTNPLLPHLFQALDMLRKSEDGKTFHWKDPECVSRAVHLLQYLVDGRTSAPEPMLVLNKVLCGVEPGTPIERELTPTDKELATCEQLLTSLIGNWKSISNTSIAGLRETFLQRQGRLHLTPEGWRLLVQRRTLDLLVDQLPWSISIVSHRWMPKPVYVTW